MSRRPCGMTLVEALVSTILVLLLTALATQGVRQAMLVMERSRARLQLHATAAVVNDRLRQEFGALMQHGALWIRTQANGLEVVALVGRADHNPFPRIRNRGSTRFGGDLAWLRVHWDADRQRLGVAISGFNRTVNVANSWGSPGNDLIRKNITILPQPRRVAAMPLESCLNDNAWGTGSPDDYGDFEELLRSTTVIAEGVASLRMQVVWHDGSATDVDAKTPVNLAYDGLRVDAQDNPPRPALLRFLIVLVNDPRLPADHPQRIKQPFSFSVPVSPILPATP